MIREIFKDYSVGEMEKFARKNPEQYKKLCVIVGEFTLAERWVNLSIVLPFAGDRGCVNVFNIKNDKINIVDIRYL